MASFNAFVVFPIMGAFALFMMVLGFVSVWSNLPTDR